MTHTVHPYSHRLGIIRDWKSRWFGARGRFPQYLKSDLMIREYLENRLHGMYVSSIEIERGTKTLRVIIETSRPGLIIGRNGEGAIKLKGDLLKEIGRWGVPVKEQVNIDIKEVKTPESNATIVGQMIAEGLEKRMTFRRVIKQIAEKVMANRDVLGVKIALSGRLGGAEMSRKEKLKKGRVPLQTFRADVDYSHNEAQLPYGKIGIKVWIYKGEIFNKTKS